MARYLYPMPTDEHPKNLSVKIEDSKQYNRWKTAAKADKRRLSDWVRITLDTAAKSQKEGK